MNKQIKELEPQCWEHNEFGLNFNYEKFALLIVAETIAVVQKRFMGDLNREDMEVRRCVEDVKKHFGVES